MSSKLVIPTYIPPRITGKINEVVSKEFKESSEELAKWNECQLCGRDTCGTYSNEYQIFCEMKRCEHCI